MDEYRWLQLLMGWAVLIALNAALVIWQTLATHYRLARQAQHRWLLAAAARSVVVLAGMGGGLGAFSLVLVAGGLRLLTLGFID